MRTLKGLAIGALVLASIVGLVAGVARLGDGPLGPFPGGVLIGELVQAPVDDWSFLDSIDRVEFQVSPAHPRSLTVWIMTHQGRPYVPAAFATRKSWPREVIEDGRVVLRVEQRLYELEATLVRDHSTRLALEKEMAAKYGGESAAEPRDGTWYFRLDPRS